MMRAAVIINPATADAPDLRERVEQTLAAAGWSSPMWLETTPEDPGAGMAEAAVAAGVQLVMICGGDGTIMACLGALVGTDVPVALLLSAPATCWLATSACRLGSPTHSQWPSTVPTGASTSAGSATSRLQSWPASDSTRQ